nr:Ubiquitin carboxyl-terminal hydrolase [Ipomoea batatas]GMD91283.1 Ubiquitin carboxyl-terminal hydrolase [Ipomoea batatas]GMD93989.1 Ubiquitin carboxyl-terminal hydrolase [Ipomoea batatas]
MTSGSKGEGSGSGSTPAPAPAADSGVECCMCGDHGLSFELFRCKSCQVRSQHRYCSNLYPKAESYRLCNWCLSDKDNSSNSSSSCRVKTEADRKIKNNISPKGKKAPMKLRVKSPPPITKQKTTASPEQSPPSVVARKRIAAAGGGSIEERLRRTKSENGIVKPVFRNKVRRYKLLEEVSS